MNKHWKNAVTQEIKNEQEQERMKSLQIQAKELGIADIDSHSFCKNTGQYYLTADTLQLAIDLTKKHMPTLLKELEERRRAQAEGRV